MHFNWLKTEQVQEVGAAMGAMTSIGGTGWVWLGHANDILQFVVLIISAFAGAFSIVYYSRKLDEKDDD